MKAQASSGRKSFGGVPERSKGSDCKSDGYAFEGSNPSPATMFYYEISCRKIKKCAAEFGARVWFNGRTSAFQAEDAGSIPATRSIIAYSKDCLEDLFE